MATTIKSRLQRYRYDVGNPEEKEAYGEFCRILSQDRKKFDTYADPGNKRKYPFNGPLEIETAHLFENQFNTVCGFRVFSWFEAIYPNVDIKEGYYIDLTSDLKEALRNTNVCGYCGNQQPAAKGYVFCDKCLDSPYLKKTDLHLTRMVPVYRTWGHGSRPELTKAELAHIMPIYVERQTTGATSRNVQKLAKQRQRIEDEYHKKSADTKDKRDGLIWLMDNGISVDNVIYYSHTGVFTFGWQNPVSDEVASAILEATPEFPFPYEIKGTDRTWEGY